MVCYLNVPCPAVPSIAYLALQPMISILSSFPLPDLRIYAKICEVLCIQITNFHIPCLWEIMLSYQERKLQGEHFIVLKVYCGISLDLSMYL